MQFLPILVQVILVFSPKGCERDKETFLDWMDGERLLRPSSSTTLPACINPAPTSPTLHFSPTPLPPPHSPSSFSPPPLNPPTRGLRNLPRQNLPPTFFLFGGTPIDKTLPPSLQPGSLPPVRPRLRRPIPSPSAGPLGPPPPFPAPASHQASFTRPPGSLSVFQFGTPWTPASFRTFSKGPPFKRSSFPRRSDPPPRFAQPPAPLRDPRVPAGV